MSMEEWLESYQNSPAEFAAAKIVFKWLMNNLDSSDLGDEIWQARDKLIELVMEARC